MQTGVSTDFLQALKVPFPDHKAQRSFPKDLRSNCTDSETETSRKGFCEYSLQAWEDQRPRPSGVLFKGAKNRTKTTPPPQW